MDKNKAQIISLERLLGSICKAEGEYEKKNKGQKASKKPAASESKKNKADFMAISVGLDEFHPLMKKDDKTESSAASEVVSAFFHPKKKESVKNKMAEPKARGIAAYREKPKKRRGKKRGS